MRQFWHLSHTKYLPETNLIIHGLGILLFQFRCSSSFVYPALLQFTQLCMCGIRLCKSQPWHVTTTVQLSVKSMLGGGILGAVDDEICPMTRPQLIVFLLSATCDISTALYVAQSRSKDMEIVWKWFRIRGDRGTTGIWTRYRGPYPRSTVWGLHTDSHVSMVLSITIDISFRRQVYPAQMLSL